MRLLSIVFFILWLILGWWMYSVNKDCCDANTTKSEQMSDSTPIVPKTEAKAVEGPILFDYKSNKALLGDNWSSYKQSLLDRLKGDDKMEITGYYTKDETTPNGFQNMGEARADAARIALGLDKNRTLLRGVVSDKEVDKENKFQGLNFKPISAKPASIEETVDDKTIIRFPYNSTDKLSDSAVESYLNKVADRVKKSGERVQLTGFTDSDGNADYNISLGKKRAEIIKSYLVGRGVASNKIITSSKGEANPIASNSTATGKAQNRRTELQIIK